LLWLLTAFWRFSKVYWVDGTSPETMEASITAIASDDEDARAAGIEARSASVLPWLASREQSWLMIFDGADGGYEEVEGFIPAGKRGSILISSRNPDMKRHASPSDAFLEVTELDKQAAATLFTKSAGLKDPSLSAPHVEAIVQELCCLPLAVDQAAASIASGLCRVDEYLDTFKRHRLHLMDDHKFKGSSNYGRAVYTTWDVSFAELERRAAAEGSESASYEAAILLLRLFSFIHFDGIREDTFRRAAERKDKWLPPLPPNSQLLLLLQRNEDNNWDFFNFRQAIRVLSMFSLVHSAGSGTYSMHRLVHQWMQDRLPEYHCSAIGLLTADVLARSEDNGQSSDDRAHRRALLVHLVTLAARLKQNDLIHQLPADTLQKMAWIYHDGGKVVDAETLLRQALSLVKKDDSEVTEQYMSIMGDLAFALYDLGKLKEAEATGQCVLKWREKHLGIDHPSTSRAGRNLALTLYQLGQYMAAKEMQVQDVAWHKVHLGMDHCDTYCIMGDLAVTLRELGELTEAKELQVQVLEGRKVHLGMDHPDIYQVMGKLATTLRKLGELTESRGLQVQVLKWRKTHLGMDHPDTYWTMDNLATTLRELGELAEARALQVKVLDWRKMHSGMDHPDTYWTMGSLANTLRELGELAEARAMQVQVLEWRKVHLGMDHPDTYWTMGSLGHTLRELGELAEARALQVQALEWQKIHLGMDHPDTYRMMGNLAITLYEQGVLAEAREMQVLVLGWWKVHLGLKHRRTIRAIENLARTLEKSGEITEAEELRAQTAEV
jgi:tetratricopeptide (TPR) repeat protein